MSRYNGYHGEVLSLFHSVGNPGGSEVVIDIDFDKLHELGYRNLPQQVIAEELGISKPTLAKRMAEIRDKQGILLKYRELQTLQLTSLQARILEHITPEKIQEAPLRDLILAFKILKEKELVMDGKPSEIHGLVGYLIELEKSESDQAVEEITDAEFADVNFAAAEVTRPTPRVPVNIEDPEFTPSFK